MSTSVVSDSIPLQERLRLKKIGNEMYNDYTTESIKETASFTRTNKNQPIEITSKKPVGRFRQVVDVKNKRPHDPRFDPLCGKLNQDLFQKSYSFLDSYKENELETLRKEVRKAKNKERKGDLQVCILYVTETLHSISMLQQKVNLLAQEIKQKKKSDRLQNALTERKRQEREAVMNGKNPFYMKRKEKKNVELQIKFQELEESGNLVKFMAKKRKKNSNKDHRWLPRKRI
uniref:rRNA biogenesis protein RRP36 n=1 Tax=Albugo laibachii Nc14 TaxID=890382 RepID=F0W524_9STRA|nr:conserved hypothetical protein [Albugo laibachii Nc14]|eukprot:CCA16215.1 conserved hypothetical protein [Albugo laibachii Nc14]